MRLATNVESSDATRRIITATKTFGKYIKTSFRKSFTWFKLAISAAEINTIIRINHCASPSNILDTFNLIPRFFATGASSVFSSATSILAFSIIAPTKLPNPSAMSDPTINTRDAPIIFGNIWTILSANVLKAIWIAAIQFKNVCFIASAMILCFPPVSTRR